MSSKVDVTHRRFCLSILFRWFFKYWLLHASLLWLLLFLHLSLSFMPCRAHRYSYGFSQTTSSVYILNGKVNEKLPTEEGMKRINEFNYWKTLVVDREAFGALCTDNNFVAARVVFTSLSLSFSLLSLLKNKLACCRCYGTRERDWQRGVLRDENSNRKKMLDAQQKA